MTNLKDSNKKLQEENLEIKKQLENINVKLADINIFDLFKDLNLNEGSVDVAKALILNLEKKVLTLEKKLMNSKKEYNIIKDKNEYIEKILRNYEKKYSGLFKFFEDCLDEFFNDEELTNNQEIFVNIDSIRKCDFSNNYY